jgi:hypothetical protein
LRNIFDNNRKKNVKLSDLEILIKFLILNYHPQVLIEALNLIDMPFSFDDFVLFCKCLFENDYETSFIHLFIFKNSLLGFFEEGFSQRVYCGNIREGNIDILSYDKIVTKITSIESLILVLS